MTVVGHPTYHTAAGVDMRSSDGGAFDASGSTRASSSASDAVDRARSRVPRASRVDRPSAVAARAPASRAPRARVQGARRRLTAVRAFARLRVASVARARVGAAVARASTRASMLARATARERARRRAATSAAPRVDARSHARARDNRAHVRVLPRERRDRRRGRRRERARGAERDRARARAVERDVRSAGRSRAASTRAERDATTTTTRDDEDDEDDDDDDDASVDEYGFAIDRDVARAASGSSASAMDEKFWTRARDAPGTLATCALDRDSALKRAVRKGVPSDLRCEAWFACSGARELKKMGPMDSYYEKLLVMKVDQKVVDQIELDLARTFPANKKYERGEGGQRGNDVLRRMLYAYARHNRKTGYCQGMNYIAAFLWLVMGDEEKAFWTFTALLDVVLPSDVHARDIKGTISQYKILHKLLQSNVPKVARHLKELDVDLVMIASKWLLCLFVESFPATTAARVLDCLTYEGEKVWFRVAIAMMKMYERDILECDSLPDVMLCLKHAFANQTDADELLKFTFERVSLSNKTIAAHREIVAAEMEEERNNQRR